MRKFAALVMGASLALGMVGSAFAATDTQNADTTLNVQSSITLTGLPATIDFGSGVPTDVKAAPDFVLNVLTNNSTGYELSFKASDMTGDGPNTEVIPATAIDVAATADTNGTGSSTTAIAVADTYQEIGTFDAHSDAAGDDFTTTVRVTIPFVESGTYTGTAAAEASTL